MKAIEIPELDIPFSFRERPESIPGDLRPLWRIRLILLMLYMASRGKKSSFSRLHVLNWALRNEDARQALQGLLDGQLYPDRIIVRIEPSLNRAVDFALGEGLVKKINGDRIKLSTAGEKEVQLILLNENLYATERAFLTSIGKKLTENIVNDLFRKEN